MEAYKIIMMLVINRKIGYNTDDKIMIKYR